MAGVWSLYRAYPRLVLRRSNLPHRIVHLFPSPLTSKSIWVGSTVHLDIHGDTTSIHHDDMPTSKAAVTSAKRHLEKSWFRSLWEILEPELGIPPRPRQPVKAVAVAVAETRGRRALKKVENSV